MTDLQKALDYRNKKIVQDILEQEVTSSNARIDSLETTRSNQNDANAAGATTNFAGKVAVAEGIDSLGPITGTTGSFSGAVTAQNEKLATENFVLANAGGTSGAGNVDVTNTYRFEATDGQTEFTFHFIGNSVGVYLGGLKLDTTDYTLTAATYDDDGNLTAESYVTLNEGASEGEIFHGVAFGGADFYSTTQADAQFMSRQDILDTYATKTELSNSTQNPTIISAFYAYNASGISTTEENIPLSFDSVKLNRGNNYDTETYKYTAPSTGIYEFFGKTLARRNSADGTVESGFYINDVSASSRGMAYTHVSGDNDHDDMSLYMIINLNEGDTVDIRAYDISDGCDLYYGMQLGHFQGRFLGI